MLFDQLPIGVLAVLMGISCAVKHTAIKRLVSTKWYQRVLQGRYWAVALASTALFSGAITNLIFHKFVGCPWAGYLGLLDACMHVAFGYYAQRIGLFAMEQTRYRRTITRIRIVYALAYLFYIWIALSLR